MLFPKEIFDHILSYVITPVPIKIGKTYYVSCVTVHGNPIFLKIKVERILEFLHQTSMQCTITRFLFEETYQDGWHFLSEGEYVKIHYWKRYNAYIFELRRYGMVTLNVCSRHTTDEAKAINILVSRLNRYSDWFTPVDRYSQANGFQIVP